MKSRIKHLLSITATIALLTSCANQKKLPPPHSNNYWKQLGYNDASQGKLPQKLESLKKDLKSSEAKQAYQNGWKSGALYYCTPNRAYELGKHGKTYNKICPEEIAQLFELSYTHGLKSFCKTHANKTTSNTKTNTPELCSKKIRTERNEKITPSK